MKTIMPWIDTLTDVDATDFPARRDRIATLVQRAAEPSADSAALLAKAYVEGCILEGDAKAHWSIREVEQAQRRVFSS